MEHKTFLKRLTTLLIIIMSFLPYGVVVILVHDRDEIQAQKESYRDSLQVEREMNKTLQLEMDSINQHLEWERERVKFLNNEVARYHRRSDLSYLD